MTAESRLVEFITATSYDDVAADAREIVRRMLLSTLATGVAGAGEDGIAALRELLLDRGGRAEATSLVYGDRLPATSAALLNGTMCRALDFCDAMAPGVHIGSSVVPAALAAAELAGGADRRTFVAALAVGAEVGARFNLTEEMYDGFDPTGIAAVFGAVAAAGRMLGLSSDQLRHALALGFNRCGGSFQSHIDGSLAVRLQQGLVAETGVVCAQLAQRGFTGPVNFLEGRYGFTHLFARELCSPAAFVDGLGDEWRLTRFMFKRFPSCGVTQGVTQQALDVVAELDLQPDDVAHVTVRMPPYSHQLVGNPFSPGANPRVSAQFSVQYCVANAIARRGASLEHFRPEMVTAPALLPLIGRIEVIADPALDRRGHSAVDFELLTTDGRGASRSYDISPGYPGNGLGAAEHRARFDDCMAYAPYPLAEDQIARLVDAVELEAYPDVRVLLDSVVIADSGRPMPPRTKRQREGVR
jgi:2-methylcitrate dehydratase PrpD